MEVGLEAAILNERRVGWGEKVIGSNPVNEKVQADTRINLTIPCRLENFCPKVIVLESRKKKISCGHR